VICSTERKLALARGRVNFDVMRLLFSMKAILLAAVFLLSRLMCPAQKQDLLGWENSRWGMSETDLVATLGSRLRKLPEPQSFLDLHANHVATFELAGEPFTVFFQMNNRTNTLSQVLVRLNEMESRLPREELFNKLDSQLMRQYGSATLRSDERDFKSTIKSVYLTHTWKFQTTTVELHYGWDSQIYASLLTISYFPAEPTCINERRITIR